MKVWIEHMQFNHSAIAPKEVPAGSKLFIYQIPDKELNANSEITDKNE